MRWMLDADVLRHLAAGDAGSDLIAAAIEHHGMAALSLSTVVAYELQAAVLNHRITRAERTTLSGWISSIRLDGFDAVAAAEAAAVRTELERSGRRIGELDILIAGHARALGAGLATGNTRHFERVRGLTVRNWLRGEI